MSNITILGAGAWGGALAQVAADNGNNVTLWTHNPTDAEFIKHNHQIPILQKNGIAHDLNHAIKVSIDLKEAIQDAEIIIFVVPSFAIRSVAEQVNAVLDKKVICVSATKGIEQKTHLLMCEILEDVIDATYLEAAVVLTGPTHAEEVILRKKTAIVAASSNTLAAEKVQEVFNNNSYFRVYVNDDRKGAELGGALKNIIAVISGMLTEYDLGDNARAGLITRGLFEMIKIGKALGAQERTFSGLAGLGDLIVTTTSPHSRNFQAGRLLAKGKSVAEIEAETGATIEGFHVTKATMEIIEKYQIYAPLINLLDGVLKEEITPSEMLRLVFDRAVKDEFTEM